MFFCKHYVELNLSLSIWVSSVAFPPPQSIFGFDDWEIRKNNLSRHFVGISWVSCDRKHRN